MYYDITDKTNICLEDLKKSLKIPMGESESVNQRRTDNTMAKRKVWRYQRGNQNGISHDWQYNNQKEKFEDIKGCNLIEVVTKTGLTVT